MQALIDSLNRLTDVLDRITSTKGSTLKSINININFSESNDSEISEMPEMPKMPEIEIPEEMLNEEF